MIPTINLNENDMEAWHQACAGPGFFYLTGHGIASNTIDRAMDASRDFFTQPKNIKDQLRRTAENCWGFYDAELTKNKRDWKEILDIGADINQGPLAGARKQMPDDEDFVAVIDDLLGQMHNLALKVTDKIVQSFGARVNLQTAFDNHTSFLRLNYYPECPDSDVQTEEKPLGINHHTDAGAVTLLAQENVDALQVLIEDRWQTIPSRGDALIVNVGDVVQVWSNDLFRAPVHRVLAQPRSRVSIPYFLNPACEFDYYPLATEQAKYRSINWGEFRSRRTAGDYADVGAEVQISDYRY